MPEKPLDPDALEKAAQEFSEKYSRAELLEMKSEAERLLLAKEAAENDNPKGFEAFFNVIFNLPLNDHQRKWVVQIYKDYARGGGTVIEAHRDSAKTTTLTIGFNAFRLGHEALRTNLLVQVGDTVADRNAKAVARIIEDNPGWKLIFPNIIPDKKSGWGVDTGFFIRDTANKKWETERAATKDPAYVGVGVNSSAIGSRPTGVFMVDDIHDEKNTASARRLEDTMNKLKGTFMPMVSKDPSKPLEKQKTWKIFVGTPWVEGDAMEYAKRLPGYSTIRTPVYKTVKGPIPTEKDWVRCRKEDRAAWFAEDEKGTDRFILDEEVKRGYWMKVKYPAGYNKHFPENMEELYRPLWYPRFNTWIRPNWPEKFDLKYIEEKWAEAGGDIEFYRMYLLDLTLLGERLFTWQDFPAEKIQSQRWIIYIGVDFATIMLDAHKPESHRSRFAMCYTAEVPGGGAVVVDGVYGRYVTDEAEDLIEQAQVVFSKNRKRTIIEGDGAGEQFFINLLRNKPMLTRTIIQKTGGRGKELRLEREMQPWLANGIVKISDADTPFLNQLRKELRNAPHNASYDAADALYWSLYGMPHVLRLTAFTMKHKDGLPNYRDSIYDDRENKVIDWNFRSNK